MRHGRAIGLPDAPAHAESGNDRPDVVQSGRSAAIAKGTVVREIDALGGIMARATDMARIQFRMLNRSKGPAVWSPRAQCDRTLYRRAVKSLLGHPNLDMRGTVARLLLEGERAVGVVTIEGTMIGARAVVLTAGTFLRGRIHTVMIGRFRPGRAGEKPAVEIAQHLEALGLRSVASRRARHLASMATPSILQH